MRSYILARSKWRFTNYFILVIIPFLIGTFYEKEVFNFKEQKGKMTVKELFMVVYFTSAFMFINVSIDGNIKGPLHFDVILDKNMSVFTFTCELSERPVGGAILVQVNFSTVDIIRHKNNSCYDKDKECQNNTCLCSYEGGKFGMEYWYKTPNVSQSYTFGVEMLLNDGKAKIVVMTLSRIYNGKDFGKLQIVKEITEFNSNENIDVTNIGLDNKANSSKIRIYLTTSLVMGLIVVYCLIWYCRSQEPSFQNVAKYYRLLSLYTKVGTYSTTYAASEELSCKRANRNATAIQVSDSRLDYHIDSINIGRCSKSILPVSRSNTFSDYSGPCVPSGAQHFRLPSLDAKGETNSTSNASAEVPCKTANSDASVIHLSEIHKDYLIDPIHRRSNVPFKVNEKNTDSASEVSSKTAKRDATVIFLSNVRENPQLENSQIKKCFIRRSSYFQDQGIIIFSGNHIQAIMAIKPILCMKCQQVVRVSVEQTEKVRVYQEVLSGLIASQSRTNGSQKLKFLPVILSVRNGLFTIQKAPSVLIDFSRQKTLDMMHHLYIQYIRFMLISCHDFADFRIPIIRKEEVLKELSNQIGKSAFHSRIELGVSFYEIDGSLFKFLKTLAALLWKRNAESKSSFNYFSIDVLKRVKGGGDKYILRWSK